MMPPAPFLQVIPQRHPMDCAVACLAMYLGKSYEEVLMAFRHNVMAQGASMRQIQMAARKLGCPLRWSRKVDLEQGSGIVSFSSLKWKADHVVVLKSELIIDTDAFVWDADVFMAAYEARPLSILTLE